MAFCRTFSGLTAGIGVLALTLGAACGNDFQSPYMPKERFAAAYAQALCQSLEHCCNQNVVAYSQPSCTQGWKAVVNKILSNPYLSENYEDQLASTCLDQVRDAQGTTCDPLPGSISAARDACQMVFFGRKLVGDLCSSPLECAPVPDSIVTCQGFPIPNPDKGLLPLMERVGALAQPGGAELHLAVIPSQRTCIAYPAPGSGASCATPDLKAICQQDATSFCDPADTTCKSRGDLGGQCTLNDGCKAGLFCTQQVCSPGQAVGQPCAVSSDCDSFLYCNGTCTDKKRPGDACTKDEECNVGVCDLQTRKCLANGIATSEACNGTDPTTVPRQ